MSKKILLLIAAIGLPMLLAPLVFAETVTVETEHFYIHHPVDAPRGAQEAALWAEYFFEQLTELGAPPPADKTHLVLIDEGDQPDGYASPYLLNVMGVSLVGPKDRSELYPVGQSWLALVISHELTHIFQMNMSGGQADSLRSAFGRVPILTSPNALLPGWFVEGAAVYYESLLTDAGRATSGIYDMYLRMLALEDDFYTSHQVANDYLLDTWPGPQRIYIYGLSLVRYLVETFGEDVVWQISAAYAEAPLAGFEEVVEETLEIPFAELWAGWQAWLKEQSLATAEAIKERGLIEGEQITSYGFHMGPPALSSGGSLAFARYGQGIPGLWLRDGQGRDKLIAKGLIGMTGKYSFHPREEILVYPQLVEHQGKLINDLFLYDLKKGQTRRLTYGRRADDPAWDPAGEWLGFIARSGDGSPQMVLRHRSSGEEKIILSTNQETILSGLSWSSDGTRLLTTVWQQTGGGLLIYDLATSQWQLFTGEHHPLGAVWFGDEQVIYSSAPTGIFNLYALELATGQVYQLTNTIGGAFHPAVDAQTGDLYYLGYHAGGYDIYHLEKDNLAWWEIGQLAVQVGRDWPEDGPMEMALDSRGYNPWEWMGPVYWWPTIGEGSDGQRVGLGTSAMDPLGRQQYALDVFFGIGDAPSGYRLQYLHRFGPDGGTAVGLSLQEELSALTSNQAFRERQWSLDLELPVSSGPLHRQSLLLSGRVIQDLTASGQTSYLALGGWTGQNLAAGGPRWTYRQGAQIYGGSLWEEEGTIFGRGEYKGYLELPRGAALALRVSGGMAEEEDFFSLGGAAEHYLGNFSLRAYPQDYAYGAKAFRATLEYRQLLWAIHQGIWDRLTLVLYGEGGDVWNQGEEMELLRSAGVELVLRQVWYHRFPSQWRVGVARAFDHPDEAWRAYLGTGFAF
ncbi:MAG: hypothetical protein ACOYD6_00315 [Limnochordia bacterium]